MSTRYEVLKNGVRHCVSGIDGDGVLALGLTYLQRPGEDCSQEFLISGLGMFDHSQQRPHHVS